MAIGVAWADGAWVDAGWVTEAWNDTSAISAWSEAAMIALIINNNTTSAPSNYLHSDRSNFRFDELKTEWTGMMVGPDEWEPRHPQDYLGNAPHMQKDIGPQNPEPNNVFISTAVSQDDL